MNRRALERACDSAYFPIKVYPDGTVVGLEEAPGNGVYLEQGVRFKDVLENLERVTDGAPAADALAVVTAMMIASHYEVAWQITHKTVTVWCMGISPSAAYWSMSDAGMRRRVSWRPHDSPVRACQLIGLIVDVNPIQLVARQSHGP